MNDQRHWPIRKQKDTAGAQPELSLEKLNLRFADNVYFAAPGQGAFNWGTSWGRHESYPALEEFRASLGIDTGSRMIEPRFVNPGANDFRLDPATMSTLKECYPQGPVPGVSLGTPP